MSLVQGENGVERREGRGGRGREGRMRRGYVSTMCLNSRVFFVDSFFG